VECWGYNSFGEVGALDGTGALVPYVQTAYPQPTLVSCTMVAASDYHVCALCDGEIYCWGDRRTGGAGDGIVSTDAAITPVLASVDTGGDPLAQIVSGRGFSCARTAGGRAFCWGYSAHGALGTGAVGSPLPVAIQLAD
jgi:alpha-tubulin suppressor-like RCC1 family protein